MQSSDGSVLNFVKEEASKKKRPIDDPISELLEEFQVMEDSSAHTKEAPIIPENIELQMKLLEDNLKRMDFMLSEIELYLSR